MPVMVLPRSAGSSPLVRGTLATPDTIDNINRFIPAGAGNIKNRPARPTNSPVHPRWCGEHEPRTSIAPGVIGSSPLVRGTFESSAADGTYSRFIPAGAGNICSSACRGSSGAVHPRWCGEHSVLPAERSAVRGSSPLVRGTYRQRPPLEPDLRFIPAGAGNIS